jgi:hypothetical protein
MTEHTPVVSCSGLSVGDRIEALRDGRVVHRGWALDVVPALELVWILDDRTETRQPHDPEMLSVLRCRVRGVPDLPEPEPSAA